MKTIIDLPDVLIQQAKQRALQQKCSLKDLIADYIRQGLQGRSRDALTTESLLVETDAPYLTPKPNRGRVNATYLMPWTVRRMAEKRNVDVEQLCDDIVANTHRAFGHW